MLVEKKIPVKDRHWAYPLCTRKPSITGLTQREILTYTAMALYGPSQLACSFPALQDV